MSKVELLSVDTEIDFAPFKTRTPKLPRPKLLANALKDVKTRKFESENVNYSEGGMIIRGYGNVVGEGLRGYLEGDDQAINESGVYLTTISGVENFANADLVFDATRNHDTNGYDLNITTDAGNYAESWFSLGNTEGAFLGYGTNWYQVGSSLASIYTNNTEAVAVSSTNINLKRSITKPYVGKTGTYGISDSDYLINCTANTFTVTLPTAVGITGREYIVKNSGSGVITLDGNGAETIDGSANKTLNQYDSITVVSDGANWIIV